MLLHANSRILARLASLSVIFILPLMLTGCLSHWFLDSSSRLQVANGTKEYTIVGIDVLADDGTFQKWITETIPPGERSRVVEEDWVGDFTLRIKYTKSEDGSGEVLSDDHEFDLEGGSLFLTVEASGDSLTYKFR